MLLSHFASNDLIRVSCIWYSFPLTRVTLSTWRHLQKKDKTEFLGKICDLVKFVHSRCNYMLWMFTNGKVCLCKWMAEGLVKRSRGALTIHPRCLLPLLARHENLTQRSWSWWNGACLSRNEQSDEIFTGGSCINVLLLGNLLELSSMEICPRFSLYRCPSESRLSHFFYSLKIFPWLLFLYFASGIYI